MQITELLYILPAALTAYVVSYMSIPVIQRIGDFLYKLQEEDQKLRDDGLKESLAGIGVFGAVLISFMLWGQPASLETFPYLVAAMVVLLMVGYKDDVESRETRRNLFLRFVAAFVLVAGIGYMSPLSLLSGESADVLTGLYSAGSIVLVMLIIISFEKLEEINGLGAGISVIISGLLGIWFWGTGNLSMTILSFSFTAAMTAFLTWPIHPNSFKIGRTGSAAMGFMVAYLSISFLSLNAASVAEPFYVENAVPLLTGLLVIPLLTILLSGISLLGVDTSKQETDTDLLSDEWKEAGLQDFHITFIFGIISLMVTGLSILISGTTPFMQIALLVAFGLILTKSIRLQATYAQLMTRMKRDNGEKRNSKTVYNSSN
ncbi:MAG: hypothetical protein LAT80_14545 [Balneolaceae bacterium]|nr:hypothetical protein [Balneolaceae bacterium]